MIERPLRIPQADSRTADFALHTLRVVFMGTPDFAVASLDALVQAGVQVVGVITAPDKPAGRGLHLHQSPVKVYAQQRGLSVLQPARLKAPEFLDALRALRADLQVVVAFRMLPEVVWNMPRLGTINLHASLLPLYRGAAPINWALINGEPYTGVTTFQLRHEIDTGDILMQERIPIGGDETAGELHDRMKVIGSRLLVETVRGLAGGTLRRVPQQELEANVKREGPLPQAPKLFTETCVINWQLPVARVHNLIRGLSPYPGAYTLLDGKMLKIYRSHPQPAAPGVPAGQWETDGKTYLRFACPDGYIRVLELQLEGKKRMPVQDFLRGYRPA
ncbi:MAG TPA: methionyl-tRNA formyltransferase [Chitinophagaceae bacterium]|nr:methionyl-tRNA formyltransferase [Chitinophagaceae bacterium]